MKPNTYEILQRCIEEGFDSGYNRSFKHLDEKSFPTKEVMYDNINTAIMNEICTYFKFETEQD